MPFSRLPYRPVEDRCRQPQRDQKRQRSPVEQRHAPASTQRQLPHADSFGGDDHDGATLQVRAHLGQHRVVAPGTQPDRESRGEGLVKEELQEAARSGSSRSSTAAAA